MASNDIKVTLNLEPLIKTIKQLQELKKPINQSIERLAMAAFDQAVSLANQKLKSDRERNLFLQNLHFEKNKMGGFDSYLIILEEPAMFIEDGAPAIDMRKTHLKGRKYVRIPFKHPGKEIPGMKDKQQNLVREIKTAMKENKMPLTKPIVNSKGSPIISTPEKPRAAALIKKVNSMYKGSRSGKSILDNLTVYQTERTNNRGNKTIDRQYMTFRTLSNESNAEWKIPAKKGVDIFSEIYKWIEISYSKFLDDQLKNLELTIK